MDLRYPIGPFQRDVEPTAERRGEWILQIDETPARLRAALDGLSAEQLDTPYRPDGWTVRQLVHHMADSHLNAYIRFKLALTEDEPTIRPYDQGTWATTPEVAVTPPEVSVALLDALHRRWVALLRSMLPADFDRTFRHPEIGLLTLGVNLGLYGWHGRHHVAHITGLRERRGW